MSDDQPTCGKGLAANATLPRAMGVVVNATADVLAHHMKALELSDSYSRHEHAVYASLVSRYRTLAREIESTAAEMASHRDLPMGRHDMAQMMTPESRDVFSRFVAAESALKQVLQGQLEQDLAMLGQM